MPKQSRIKTNYPGVVYVDGMGADGKPERIYYIRYRKDGKPVEEKAGRARKDDMTPAKANRTRSARITGGQSNQERRDAEEKAKQEEEGRQTISKLWEAYKENKPNLKGIITDENRFLNHLKPVFGDKTPDVILPLDVDRLRLKMAKTHSPATVRNTLELLRRIINFGEKKQLSPGLSFTIEMPSLDNEKTEDLSTDEMARLLKAMDESNDVQAVGLMRLALFTGMRRGELFRLQWDDIDLKSGFITIREPKGGKTERIPLNESAREVLRNHPKTESPFVFPGRGSGQRVDASKAVNKIKQAAGLPKSFRALHGLRHTFASMLASSGKVDMYTLQKLMTHKSAAMTQRYSHLRDETLMAASGVVDDIFSNVTSEPANVLPIRKNVE